MTYPFGVDLSKHQGTNDFAKMRSFTCGDEQHKAGGFEMDYPFGIDIIRAILYWWC